MTGQESQQSVSLPERPKVTDEGSKPLAYTGSGAPEGGPPTFPKRQFGKDVAKEFAFDPTWHNLNHGSFGTIPRAIQTLKRHYQDQYEARPDHFIRWHGIELLDESRAAVAPLLGVPTETVVFVANATTGVNVVLRALEWADDKLDEILYFNTIYGACVRTIDFVVETSRGFVGSRCVALDYPCDDDEVVARFRAAVRQAKAEGKRPRVAVIDVVSSIPGLRFPFEAVVAACRDEGLLSLVDGAQGIGMVDLSHVGQVDPDFFVTNAHKWLHVPRGCAVFHVPLRNQALIRSTLPTSHGFIPRPDPSKTEALRNPLPPPTKSAFLSNFQFVGTVDDSNYFCVKDGIRWRAEVLGGEEKIREYVTGLAKKGGARVAELLGTEILENSKGTLTNCCMVNVALPVGVLGNDGKDEATLRKELVGIKSVVAAADALVAANWMQKTMADEYKTFLPVFVYKRRIWVRLSAQVYLDMDDFEWAAKTLEAISERTGKGEFKK